MADNKKRRFIAEKVALPAVLAISLLAAKVLVNQRSAIRLSAPIELGYSGLSVSMPLGNGWQCEGKWVYQENSFAVSSIFLAGSGMARPYARCHYLLASQPGTPQERFIRNRGHIGEEDVVETGRTEAGAHIVDWAKIKVGVSESELGLFEIIFGVCKLAAGRELEIEIFQPVEEQGLGQRAFDEIVKSIIFSDNGLLQAGEQIVSEVRNEGLGNILTGGSVAVPETTFFAIADAHDRTIGFTMDALVPGTNEEPNVKGASYYYVGGPLADEQVGFFRGDSAFEKYTWRVESISRKGSIGVEMFSEGGVLEVRRLRGDRENSEYVLGKSAVPDILLEPVLRKIVDSNREDMIMDVIRSDGTITPVRIERMEHIEKGLGINALKLQLLDGHGHWQRIYFDEDNRLVRIVLEQDKTYTLKRSSAKEIMEMFPERAYLIKEQDRLLEREGL